MSGVAAGLIVALALGAGGAAAALWLGGRFATVSVAVNLRNGEKYARLLDGLVEGADYSTPTGRAAALSKLARSIEEPDVVDGLVVIHHRLTGKDAAGERAESTAREQMQYLGINPGAVNVSTADGQGVRLDPRHAKGGHGHSDACVAAVVATLSRRGLADIWPGDTPQALAALSRLQRLSGADIDALYLFYTPNAGEPMDPITANRIFLDLRAAANR